MNSTGSDRVVRDMLLANNPSISTTQGPSLATKNPVSPPSPDDPQSDYRNMSWNRFLKLCRARRKANRPPDAPVRPRRPFHASDKKAVCEMHEANPGLTHQQIADRFGIHRSMISKILAEKETWLQSKHTEGVKIARKRFLKYDRLERPLKSWLLICRKDGVFVTDKMIKEKALLVAEQKGMRRIGGDNIYFHGERAWLRGFKERYGVVDGVATRLGYTPMDLAREKAYGNFPLDDPFWLYLPDASGNIPEPSRPPKQKYDDFEFEVQGHILIVRPPARHDRAAQPSPDAPDPSNGRSTSQLPSELSSGHPDMLVESPWSTGPEHGGDRTSSLHDSHYDQSSDTYALSPFLESFMRTTAS